MTHNEPSHKLTVKIGDALRTIQGYTLSEYQMARAELIDGLQDDLEAVQLAKAVASAAPIVGGGTAVAAPAAAVPAAPLTAVPDLPAAPPAPPASGGWGQRPAAAPSFAQATTPSCDHGPRTPRSGVGAKGPWKAWFCPAKKGDPTQCQGIFINRNTPEWDAFPA